MTNQDEKDLVAQSLEDPKTRREMEYEWFVDETIVKIERVMEEMGISRTELATKLQCSPANVTQLLRHGSNLTLKTLMDLALALEHRFLSPEIVPASALAPWESSSIRVICLVSPQWTKGVEFDSASYAWPQQAREAESKSASYTIRQTGEFNVVQ
jgi:transcriptional regulator with XRE-family HTH domain